ncbi:MAG: ABC transporter ATP-binding protein [Pelotomaculum sp.]|nr:ABC transporter ATP-binding protein [Pelotomaculum sp.]
MLIAVKNLTKVYGKGPLAVRALDVESLEIGEGEMAAVTGPSGCGKTTLLNLIGALDRPTGGEIFFKGERISGRGEAALCRFRREKVGFVFQAYHLIPSLSALKNVLVPAVPLGGGRVRRARELLRLVGLAGKEGRRPGELSGGEQQRVAVARALLLDPELILADEPTGNLDSAAGAEIVELLKSLNRRGKTVIVATHDRQVAKACGRVIRLADGRVVS